MGLFVKDGSITLSGFLILMGIPLAVAQSLSVGFTLVLMGFLNALFQAVNEIKEQDKQEIRFYHMSAADIGDELEALNVACLREGRVQEEREKCLAALAALAKKYGKYQAKRNLTYHPHELETICQDAAYTVLKLYPSDDEAVAAALALHALVAKDEQVRERHFHEADVFGLNIPVQAMREGLKRAQETEAPSEEDEQLSAELQRKGCLLLGALADGDTELATKIVDEGGLEAILDCLSWFRFHEEVANWGLWAIFVLCYDHPGNKAQLLRLGGIQTICKTMKNIPDSLEVSRHGIAVLFDMMREAPETPADVSQIRKIALSAGLHNVLSTAMDNFDDSMEIMMMGQEMLVATGYKGEIPQYQPIS